MICDTSSESENLWFNTETQNTTTHTQFHICTCDAEYIVADSDHGGGEK